MYALVFVQLTFIVKLRIHNAFKIEFGIECLKYNQLPNYLYLYSQYLFKFMGEKRENINYTRKDSVETLDLI